MFNDVFVWHVTYCCIVQYIWLYPTESGHLLWVRAANRKFSACHPARGVSVNKWGGQHLGALC